MGQAAQSARAAKFRELHAAGTFVIANAWDGGSARILSSLGFPALATSSGAAAGVLGRLDHGITLEESLANARLICESTDLPVSADLEKGFGDAPADAARAITRAAEVGLVGGSIEDATGRRDQPIYDASHAAERIAAAVEADRRVWLGAVPTTDPAARVPQVRQLVESVVRPWRQLGLPAASLPQLRITPSTGLAGHSLDAARLVLTRLGQVADALNQVVADS